MVLTYVKHVNHLRNDTGWSNCKCWYHDCCFATCFNSSLKQLYLVVWIVLLNYFMNFAAYFTYPNLLILTSSATYGTLMLITTTHWASLKIVSHNLLKKNITNHYIFTMPDQVSERSFLNKKSDCWLAHCWRFCIISPLLDCLWVSKDPSAATLYSLFQNMSNGTSVSLSIVELEKITNACSVEMNLSFHQNIDELYKNIVLNLIQIRVLRIKWRPYFSSR